MLTQVQNAAKIIWDFLNVKDPPQNADAIFVLGGSSLLPVKKASELYKKGLSKYIVFHSISGTFSNPQWKESEAKTYYKNLIKLGIPKKAIIWDELTTNTLDEAKTSIKFMKTKGLEPKKVILISRPVHQRRAWLTFKKQNPEIYFINCPAQEKLEITNNLCERLVGEIRRLKTYGKKGDLVVEKLPKEVEQSFKVLKTLQV